MQIHPEQSSPAMDGPRRLGGKGGSGGGGGNGRVVALALLSAAVALVLWEVMSGALNPWEQQQLLSRRLVHAVVGSGPLPAVGPRLAPWAINRSCLVYILDASEELAPAAGVPQCKINDPEVCDSGY